MYVLKLVTLCVELVPPFIFTIVIPSFISPFHSSFQSEIVKISVSY